MYQYNIMPSCLLLVRGKLKGVALFLMVFSANGITLLAVLWQESWLPYTICHIFVLLSQWNICFTIQKKLNLAKSCNHTTLNFSIYLYILTFLPNVLFLLLNKQGTSHSYILVNQHFSSFFLQSNEGWLLRTLYFLKELK